VFIAIVNEAYEKTQAHVCAEQELKQQNGELDVDFWVWFASLFGIDVAEEEEEEAQGSRLQAADPVSAALVQASATLMRRGSMTPMQTKRLSDALVNKLQQASQVTVADTSDDSDSDSDTQGRQDKHGTGASSPSRLSLVRASTGTTVSPHPQPQAPTPSDMLQQMEAMKNSIIAEVKRALSDQSYYQQHAQGPVAPVAHAHPAHAHAVWAPATEVLGLFFFFFLLLRFVFVFNVLWHRRNAT
jgi:hypothetical protein